MSPVDSGAASAPPPPPRAVRLSRTLWITGAVLGAAGSVQQLADRGRLLEELRRSKPDLTQEQLDSAATGGVLFGLLFTLGLLAVYIMLANRMVRGANWARVTLAVIGGLSVLFGMIGLVGIFSGLAASLGLHVGALDVVISVLVLGLDAAALTAMFLPPANAWFTHLACHRNRRN
ncbi:hypothetical protein GCM10012275_45410 [Longimycelium tulufanense]|uniref:Uncharacterized protein n=2 Tax=Longimycelium tulufanense TaxID=907463 RepID=A0A8J3FXP1_9PSEU|nr:hypothetical protein GCM10012275_45410 [Longimycelium tulufanense]